MRLGWPRSLRVSSTSSPASRVGSAEGGACQQGRQFLLASLQLAHQRLFAKGGELRCEFRRVFQRALDVEVARSQTLGVMINDQRGLMDGGFPVLVGHRGVPSGRHLLAAPVDPLRVLLQPVDVRPRPGSFAIGHGVAWDHELPLDQHRHQDQRLCLAYGRTLVRTLAAPLQEIDFEQVALAITFQFAPQLAVLEQVDPSRPR